MTVLGRHAEARRAYEQFVDLYLLLADMSAAEAKTLPPVLGAPARAATLALAPRDHGPPGGARHRGVALTPVRRRTPGGSSGGARFRFVQLYAAPHCGSSTVQAELERLFGGVKQLRSEWPVLARVAGCPVREEEQGGGGARNSPARVPLSQQQRAARSH